ncbi:ATP-binding protein [Streptomyces sp. NPDC091290]|uniref:ATP-binding protein n=1 Tax=Streptomyces sp. NPDC091290 TaxID=3365990 RepID=UPI00380236B0
MNRSVIVTTSCADTATARELRRRLTQALLEWGARDVADVAELLAAELLANAVQHALHTDSGCARVTLVARQDRCGLRVEVADPDPSIPVMRHATADDEGGRGLALVEALADRWGVTERPTGKTVWFSLTPATAGTAV